MVEIEETPQNEKGLDVTPKQDGGVLKVIKREGHGATKPNSGDTVTVHYVGTLTDGSKFDSSRDRGDPFEFVLGKGSVIKSWDIGVATMLKGEICELTCGSEYAYGKAGSPPKIPADATLVFEVELLSWQGEDLTKEKDGGVVRSRIKEGDGYSSPNDEATVGVHVIGRHDGRAFDDRDLTFVLGEGEEVDVPAGVERALKKFKLHERSLLTLKPEYAFGRSGHERFGVPADAAVEYEITLNSFEKAKESWEMDKEEKLEQAEVLKEKGTTFFKNGKFGQAVKSYETAVKYLENETYLDDDKVKCDQVLLAAHLNIALCSLKLNKNLDAVKHCEDAMKIDANNEKAFFRRGMAKQKHGGLRVARDDFLRTLDVNSKNRDARRRRRAPASSVQPAKDQGFPRDAERSIVREHGSRVLRRRIEKHGTETATKTRMEPTIDDVVTVLPPTSGENGHTATPVTLSHGPATDAENLGGIGDVPEDKEKQMDVSQPEEEAVA
ncbi:PREDICTED: peptidyl-prolyl cis-trans isomerase FKBP4-like isoform X2 [Priapulus caudatus]|uniref:peptidylprolyl isomerase n=1 Tax=Priapulus caudatus TaxID=37621 RepID=A0ABM1EG70_PRICU|nr:PREDICTED: peptidyl-prolyl cis-trans isomerase FKBP4-like isoform X2 [Priapulus caudatus]